MFSSVVKCECVCVCSGVDILNDDVIAVYEEHEDSVYACVWSVADAWVFASLSFDGRVVVNHVPSQEKFTILTS